MFYVYTYTHPTDYRIIYVGKGTGSRMYQHWNTGVVKNQFFKNTLEKLRKENLEPIISKVFETTSEEEAYEFEEFLIREIGRKEDGGTLCNIFLGGVGGKRLHNFDENFYKRLGNEADISISKDYSVSPSTVKKHRDGLGIPVFDTSSARRFKWNGFSLSLLGKDTDSNVGKILGVTKTTIKAKRKKLNIPAFDKRPHYTTEQLERHLHSPKKFFNKNTGEELLISITDLADRLNCKIESVMRSAARDKVNRRSVRGWLLYE